ncbi:MAG: rhodanese-like domain-containing protein [Cyclobacteriaceae bacterium]
MGKEKIICLTFLFAAFSTFAQSDYDKKLKSLYRNTVPIIQPTEVKALMAKGEKITIVDTRAPEEFKVSHLEGARFLDYGSYTTDDLKKIPSNTKVIVYCSVGYRSERVGEKLLKLGYKNVFNIYGGIFEWKNEGQAVVNKQNQPTDSVHTYNKNWSKWLVKGVKVY